MMKLITLVLSVLAILPMSKAISNPPESAPTYSPETASSYSRGVPIPSVVKLCNPTPPEVEIGCAEQVTAHYYLHDPRIQPECCAAIFRDEDCVAPRLSGLQLTPFGHDLKNYCSTIHY